MEAEDIVFDGERKMESEAPTLRLIFSSPNTYLPFIADYQKLILNRFYLQCIMIISAIHLNNAFDYFIECEPKALPSVFVQIEIKPC